VIAIVIPIQIITSLATTQVTAHRVFIGHYKKMGEYFLISMLNSIMGVTLSAVFMLWRIREVMVDSAVVSLLKKVYALLYYSGEIRG